ncbi:TPA: hypothetical protein N0F65_007277 [Lagenidium giganteum]|uniref:Uncharacterized protein n=1 Tax=Lagenidium giganteum TaxID=4803 RepID=A0AAV2Z6D4_9STRA|nr:TPA: hypothetical protein N0F65_007277 [Lagenidium giganteum]
MPTSASPSTPVSTVTVPPHERCKYPSKQCLQKRATKKTGALHSFCEYHRAMANRNQRRLEQRRRINRRVVEEGKNGDDQCGHASKKFKTENAAEASIETVPELAGASFEPFQYPVPLQMEDLYMLYATLVEQEL